MRFKCEKMSAVNKKISDFKSWQFTFEEILSAGCFWGGRFEKSKSPPDMSFRWQQTRGWKHFYSFPPWTPKIQLEKHDEETKKICSPLHGGRHWDTCSKGTICSVRRALQDHQGDSIWEWLTFGKSIKTGWWFQPIWKILVKLDHFPNFRGEHEKCLSCHHLADFW